MGYGLEIRGSKWTAERWADAAGKSRRNLKLLRTHDAVFCGMWRNSWSLLLLYSLNRMGMDLFILDLRRVPTSAQRFDQIDFRDHLLAR